MCLDNISQAIIPIALRTQTKSQLLSEAGCIRGPDPAYVSLSDLGSDLGS